MDGLPPDVGRVLREAAEIVVARDPRYSVLDLTRNVDGVRFLLKLLTGSAGLRISVRGRLKASTVGFPSGPVASDLIAAEQATVEQACAAVSRMLRQAVADDRHTRRKAKRADQAVPAEQRQEKRYQSRLDDVRKARDLAQRRLESAQAENNDLAREIARIRKELDDVRGELSSLRDQVHRDRDFARNPHRTAARLASLLRLNAPRAAIADTRGVQAGEPRRVGLAPEAVDLAESLQTAARQSGIPADLRLGIATWLPDLLDALAEPRTPPVVVGDDLGLTVDVLGGGTEIGGSCVLLSAGGTRILIDAGARPSGHDERTIAPRHLSRALEDRIDAIIVTHAHNDHGGWVPVLVRDHPETRLFMTTATRDLLRVMWRDSAKVLAGRAADPALSGWTGGQSGPFTREDVERAVRRCEPVEFGQRLGIGALGVELFPAGHIVGAAGVVIHAGDRRVVVSGDVSATQQATVCGIVLPDSALGSDLLLLESTYAGLRKLTSRERAVSEFVRKISDVVSGGGRVLVPAFALGRAQEVALVLNEHLPEVEVLIDGMARSVSTVYEEHESPNGSPLRIFGGNVREVRNRHRELSTFTNGVIVSTSGMLTSGPAVEWAERILREPQSALMIVGYQDEESPGRKLLDLTEKGGGKFDLAQPGGARTAIRVACHVDSYQLGAHASADELVAITQKAAAAKVMLVHGERERQRQFAERLALRNQATAAADRLWQAD